MSDRKALVADDETHIRTLLGTVLRTIGFEVVGSAGDGNEAVAQFSAKRPDLVLLDVNMPYKDGTEALKEIRELSKEVCVIMLTSVSDLETVKECLTLGASNYIRKDTPIDQMKKMIQETWEARQ